MTEAAEPMVLEAVLDPEVVQQFRGRRAQGWGVKRIARELEIARNTVKRYFRGGDAAQVQVRPQARALDDGQRGRAMALFDGVAEISWTPRSSRRVTGAPQRPRSDRLFCSSHGIADEAGA